MYLFLDIKKQIHELATAVYQIRGHIRGLTLLPFPQGASMIDDEERKVRETNGKDVDTLLKNNIEAIVSKWAYQVFENFLKISPLISTFRLMKFLQRIQLKK